MPNLKVVKCEECTSLQFSPVVVCRQCGAEHVIIAEIPGRGELYTFTIIHVPPDNWNKQVPYVVGVLRMTNGLLLTASYAKDSFDKLKLGADFDVWIDEGRFAFQ